MKAGTGTKGRRRGTRERDGARVYALGGYGQLDARMCRIIGHVADPATWRRSDTMYTDMRCTLALCSMLMPPAYWKRYPWACGVPASMASVNQIAEAAGVTRGEVRGYIRRALHDGYLVRLAEGMRPSASHPQGMAAIYTFAEYEGCVGNPPNQTQPSCVGNPAEPTHSCVGKRGVNPLVVLENGGF